MKFCVEATLKLLYLVIRNVSKNLKICDKLFKEAIRQLASHFEGRIPEC